MTNNVMNIGELAAAAGLSRRAVRFYVERRLVAPPQGRGRGCQYDQQHLQQLRRVRELQSIGHSLDAIKRIQNGEAVAPPEVEPAVRTRARHRATLTARLWTRIEITDGVELHLDANKHNPDVGKLLMIANLIRQMLGRGAEETQPREKDGES